MGAEDATEEEIIRSVLRIAAGVAGWVDWAPRPVRFMECQTDNGTIIPAISSGVRCDTIVRFCAATFRCAVPFNGSLVGLYMQTTPPHLIDLLFVWCSLASDEQISFNKNRWAWLRLPNLTRKLVEMCVATA